jgi:hypothetical protein
MSERMKIALFLAGCTLAAAVLCLIGVALTTDALSG